MDKSSNPPPNQPFSRMPQRQPRPEQPSRPPVEAASSLDKSDGVSLTGQASSSGPKPPPTLVKMDEGTRYPSGTTTVSLEDGSKIVKYAQPQKLSRLLKDAKAIVGGESSRFFGKGWVIGDGVAKISPDGTSVTYFPPDVAELVHDLLGPDSEII